MPRRSYREPPVGRPVKFYWDNPPGPHQGGSVERLIGNRIYERTVGPGDLLDIQEAAAALGSVHTFSVYRAIWEGRLEAVRQGRKLLVPLQAVKRYLHDYSGRPGRPTRPKRSKRTRR